MNIALIGATGTIGQRILKEALARKHLVTAIVRDPARLAITDPNLTVRPGEILAPESIIIALDGTNVLISAFGPGKEDPNQIVAAARSLLTALRTKPSTRLIVVGGAGSLEVAPGKQLVDTPDFPAAWKPPALAHREALEVYRAADPNLNWTYVSPAAFIQPGERTGHYRTDTDQLIRDAKGESRISAEDFAVAILDEVAKPQFLRRRFAVAY
jgi:putative NADH-flavin reductase